MQKIKIYLKSNIGLILIALSAIVVRLYKLTSVSLWHDEAFSALLIKYSWPEMMHRIGLDVHPPMYYIFLRFWHYAFGDSLFALRLMSLFFGVLTVLAVYYFVLYAFKNQKFAYIAAIIIALNPFQVQYVSEARMYTMGAFFVILAALSLVAALRNQVQNSVVDNPKYKWYFGLFVLFSSILMYTHYYLLFSVAAFGVYGLWYIYTNYKFEWKAYVPILLSGLALVVLYIPWIPTFIFQFNQVGAGYWIPMMDIRSIPSDFWLVAISVVSIYCAYKFLKKFEGEEKWLIIGSILAPFAGALLFWLRAKLVGQTSSVYLVRYFIFTSSFYLIMFAAYFSTFKWNKVRVFIVATISVVSLISINYYWQQINVNDKPGMAAAAQYLNSNVEPNHKLFVGSSFVFFNFKYYNQTGVKPLLFSNGSKVSDMPHFAGTAILTDEDLVKNFSEAVKPSDTVWLLWTTAFGSNIPTVPENWTQINQKEYTDAKPYPGAQIFVTTYRVK
jgi:mannosyltransferase